MQQPRYSPAPPIPTGIRPPPPMARPPAFANVSIGLLNFTIILFLGSHNIVIDGSSNVILGKSRMLQ